MTVPTRRSRGFTLVELMVVVAIVGILSSVAIPSFGRLILRSKTSERAVVLSALRRAAEDYFVRYEGWPNQYGSGASKYSILNLNWNPPLLPTDNKRGLERRNWDDWSKISVAIDGYLYHSYYMYGYQSGSTIYYYDYIYGDLDGDRDYFAKYEFRWFQNGHFEVTAVWPPPGSIQDQKF